MSGGAVAAVEDRLKRTMALLGVGWIDGCAYLGEVMVASSAGQAKRLSRESARSAHLGDRWRTVMPLERVCVGDLACEGHELPRLEAPPGLLVPHFGVDARRSA